METDPRWRVSAASAAANSVTAARPKSSEFKPCTIFVVTYSIRVGARSSAEGL